MGYEPKILGEAERLRQEELQAKLELPNGASIIDLFSITYHSCTPDTMPNLPILERQNIVDYYLTDPQACPTDLNNLNL